MLYLCNVLTYEGTYTLRTSCHVHDVIFHITFVEHSPESTQPPLPKRGLKTYITGPSYSRIGPDRAGDPTGLYQNGKGQIIQIVLFEWDFIS